MKSRLHLLLIIGVIVVSALVALARQDQKQVTQKPVWEYWTPSQVQGHALVNLNKLGGEGWELVTVRAEEEVIGNFHQTRVHYYLKRQR